MKIFALLCCLFAVATASYSPYNGIGLYGYGSYHGPQHLPVIGPNGVPLEEPANVAARQQHAAAVVEAKARNGDYGYGGYAGAYGYAAGVPAVAYGYGHGYAAHGVPVIGPHGVPLELPANVAARAQHAVAVAQTKARDYGYAGALYGGHGLYGHGLYAAQHVPVIGPHGVPLEPPANVAARLQHAAAHAAARAHTGYYGHWRKRRSVYGAYYGGYPGPQHIPVIGPNGVPLEPPANVAARAQHAAAHAAASHGAYYAPGAYGAYGGYGAYGAYGAYGHGVPLTINGVPQDTPAVAHAKVAHFAAVAEAKSRVGLGYGAPYAGLYAAGPYAAPYGYARLSHSGLPLDTPEVAAAKVAHLAAHAAVAHGAHY
ncbi:shematrin-like protein 1 [Chrysoperla carnea]|uniref:shematrin-like protein 1 n=1 Tax=Chrysoperla carnea TaxID=189513 RepID=UPI001D08917A|nr:shematrin-like protein 1 [Chrysoperla carnea]